MRDASRIRVRGLLLGLASNPEGASAIPSPFACMALVDAVMAELPDDEAERLACVEAVERLGYLPTAHEAKQIFSWLRSPDQGHPEDGCSRNSPLFSD